MKWYTKIIKLKHQDIWPKPHWWQKIVLELLKDFLAIFY